MICGKADARKQLISDLEVLIFEPIRIVADSVAERLIEVIGKSPIIASDKIAIAKRLRNSDPRQGKDLMIKAIDEMFDTLHTMTGVAYPRIRDMQKKGTNHAS